MNPFRLIGLTRLRSRLALIIAVALAPAGMLALVQGVNGIDAAAERRSEQLKAQSLAAIDKERAAVMEIRQAVRLTAAALRTEMRETGGCAQSFAELGAKHDWATRALILKRNGESACGEGPPVTLAGDADWDSFLSDPRYFISTQQRESAIGARSFMIFQPLWGGGETTYALAVGVDFDYLRRLAHPGPGQPAVTLLNRVGEAVFPGEDAGAARLPEDRARLLPYNDRQFDAVGGDGLNRTYFSSALEPGQLWAVTSALEPSWRAILLGPEGRVILTPLALWLIAVIAAYFAIDALVTRHVGALRRTAVRIGHGELDAPMRDFRDAPAEIRALADAIGAMAVNLGERDNRLRDTLDVQRRLLLEVHHRVKNNLQTISSMMNLESRRARDPESRHALRVIQDRIHSLAMVHQNLYATKNLEEVALDQLTLDISAHIVASLAAAGAEDSVKTDLDPVVVPTAIATPVALFLSETLSNAFKHGGKTPTVKITLKREGEMFFLTIRNSVDGERRDEPDGSGLGIRLMEGFARQIDGDLKVTNLPDAFEACLSGPIAPPAELFQVRRRVSDA